MRGTAEARGNGSYVAVAGANARRLLFVLLKGDATMNKRKSQGRPNTEEVGSRFCARAVVVFAFGLLSLLLASSFPNPTAAADPIEVDHFPHSRATVEILTPFGPDTVSLSGPTTVEVDLGSLADADMDGREEIQTEIVSMELTGHSSLLGPVTLRLRDPAEHPSQRSLGKMEENNNVQAGRLDLLGDNLPLCVEHPSPPPNCVGTTADSFFDVYFEVEAAGMVLHNQTPKHMVATITHKPPAQGETYENPDPIPLYNESEVQVATVTSTFHTPNPAPVGGIAEFPPLAGTSPEEAGTHPGGSGWSAGSYAALAGGLAAALLTISAGAWYARRRWVR
jgi:hypothetical protein